MALPCGSRSTTRTRKPSSASAAPRLTVVVVLPTPPFWLAIAMTAGRSCGSPPASPGLAPRARLVQPPAGPGRASPRRGATRPGPSASARSGVRRGRGGEVAEPLSTGSGRAPGPVATCGTCSGVNGPCSSTSGSSAGWSAGDSTASGGFTGSSAGSNARPAPGAGSGVACGGRTSPSGGGPATSMGDSSTSPSAGRRRPNRRRRGRSSLMSRAINRPVSVDEPLRGRSRPQDGVEPIPCDTRRMLPPGQGCST